MRRLTALLALLVLALGCTQGQAGEECYIDNEEFVLSDYEINPLQAEFLILNESGSHIVDTRISSEGDFSILAIKILPVGTFEDLGFLLIQRVAIPQRGEYSGKLILDMEKENGGMKRAVIVCSGTISDDR